MEKINDSSGSTKKIIPREKNPKNKWVTEEDINSMLSEFGIEEKVRNIEHYKLSFIHKSYLKMENESEPDLESDETDPDCIELQSESNERLEYLGDKIISATVGYYLYNRYPKEQEGFLTKIRTKIEERKGLARLSRKLKLSRFVLISKHVEEICDGRRNPKILEDIFESFIGAMFLDFGPNPDGIGFSVCEKFLIRLLETYVDFSDLIYRDNNYIILYQKKGKLMKKCLQWV
jgi:dsRNA-specific ribonuclease